MSRSITTRSTNPKIMDDNIAKLEEHLSEAVELPKVTSEDNGAALQVVNGAWAKGLKLPELPIVAISDEGKALLVNSSGAWEASNIEGMAHIKKYSREGTTIEFPVPKGNAVIFVGRNMRGLYMKLTNNNMDTIFESSEITSATYDASTETCTIVSNNQYTHEVIVIY